ncbi:hypothetical protein SNE40_011400 [Patella caerulea]|uniref:Hydrogen voltage-gated channel 1 n=1 Tax=Patella caerulea TaxID=87958 RepID=A0AAN8JJT6_PATCE
MTIMKHRQTLQITAQRNCMDKLESSLYGVCIESSVITLTTISVLAITGELLIGLKIIQEPPNSNGRVEVTGQNVTTDQPTDQTGDESKGDSIKTEGDNLSTNLVIASSVFHYISLVIAALFLVEIILKIISRGKPFCISPIQIIDCFIILVALGLEITFTIVTLPQPYWEALTYVIILRYWRIPYVCNIRADARRVEFEQEIESWRIAKQKSDEKCRSIQYKLDHYKLDNMVNSKTNGHIPGKKADREESIKKRSNSDPTINGVGVSNDKTPNGITKSSQNNGHSIMIEDGEDCVDSKINNSKSADNKDNVKPVKSVNFDVSFDTDATPSPSISPVRHLNVSEKGGYTRTDSESSLSYQATEEEVVVQIETLKSPPISPTDDTSSLLPGDQYKEEYVFDNVMFEDEDDLVLRKDLQVMADIDGTKTYRSADGIPMTSL